MSLLSRLIAPAPGEEKLPVHQFMAALAELKRAAPGVTTVSIATAFGLSPAEETELEAFATRQYIDGIQRELVHDVLMLGEYGTYTIENCEDRLVNLTVPTDLLPLTYQRQFQIIARGLNDCVLSGCAVTAQGVPDMTLAVAKGAVLNGNAMRAVVAASVTITAAHATLPRIDMVVVDSSGAKVVRAGSAVPSPRPPELSANDVALAIVYVAPGDTAIESNQILDTRIVRATGPVCIGKVTTPVVRANTSAAQTFVLLTIPNGLFLAGRMIRVSMGGTMLLNSGSPTITLAISYGGTTMFQDVTGAATADADRLAWNLDFVLVAQANNDQSLSGTFKIGPVAAKTAPTTGVGDIIVPGVLSSSQVSGPFSGAAAVDSDSANRDLVIQLTMSVANPNDEIAMEYATGELF